MPRLTAMHEAGQRLARLHLETLAGGDAAIGPWHDHEHPPFVIRNHAVFDGAVDLPPPDDAVVPLERVLALRRSTPAFGPDTVALQGLATVLQRAVALPGDAPESGHAKRRYPSGGGLAAVEILVATSRVLGIPAGLWHYQPLARRLVPWPAPEGTGCTAGCFANPQLPDSAAVLLMYADFSRPSFARYGSKAYRLVLLEAGHLGQNLMLVAAEQRLAALPLCGFDDRMLARCCGLDFPAQAVLYAMALGQPPLAEQGPPA